MPSRRWSREAKKNLRTVNIIESDEDPDDFERAVENTIVSDVKIYIKLIQTPQDAMETGELIESGKYVGIIREPNEQIVEGLILVASDNKQPDRLNIISQQTLSGIQQLVMEIVK